MPLTSNHAQQLAHQIAEHQRFFYWLRRRMPEWGFPPTDETLALVAKTDDLLSELRTQVYFLGCKAENERLAVVRNSNHVNIVKNQGEVTALISSLVLDH